MSPSLDTRENREFATELKFLLPKPLADQLRQWARARLTPDPHGTTTSGDAYQITSIYLDTEAFDVFHRRGSFGRSKYRIRRYGEGTMAFLERKLKTRGLLSKRRSIVRLDELARLGEPKWEKDWPGCWFHQRLQARRLRPVCQISYRRTARVLLADFGPIRLTLDDDIGVLPATNPAFQTPREGVLLLEGQTILELKFRGRMPILFEMLVNEFGLKPQAFSKYRRAVIKLGYVPEVLAVFPAEPQAPLRSSTLSL